MWFNCPMKKDNPSPILGAVLRKVAPRLGAVVTIEPVWQIVGQIAFKNGRKCYFCYSTLDLNPMGASELARDKDFANFFLKKEDYPVVKVALVQAIESLLGGSHCRW